MGRVVETMASRARIAAVAMEQEQRINNSSTKGGSSVSRATGAKNAMEQLLLRAVAEEMIISKTVQQQQQQQLMGLVAVRLEKTKVTDDNSHKAATVGPPANLGGRRPKVVPPARRAMRAVLGIKIETLAPQIDVLQAARARTAKALEVSLN